MWSCFGHLTDCVQPSGSARLNAAGCTPAPDTRIPQPQPCFPPPTPRRPPSPNPTQHGPPQDDASRARGELRALRQAHEELLVRHREEVGRADLQLAELLGEAKLRAFELQRVQVWPQEGVRV